jgi:hypothetical protein
MIKKVTAITIGMALMVAMAACGPVTVHTDHDFVGGNPCAAEQTWLQVDITGSYPTGNPADPVYVDPNVLVDLLFQAFSPDPEYGGVVYVGTGLSRTNPEIIDAATPYYANVCFRADKAVAILVRAWLAAPTVREAGVGIRCAIHKPEVESLGDQVDEVRTDAADLIEPATNGYDIITQCVYIYVPGNWAGPPMPEQPFPPLDRHR